MQRNVRDDGMFISWVCRDDAAVEYDDLHVGLSFVISNRVLELQYKIKTRNVENYAGNQVLWEV